MPRSSRPVRGSTRGLAVSCGINPRLRPARPLRHGRLRDRRGDPQLRGGRSRPDRIALLDNFCWGNTERPETLGSLVRAAQGCLDVAVAYGTPFVSGKDSLYNEYTHEGKSRAIPPTLLISAMGQVLDVRKCVTMDLKKAGNLLFVLGQTRLELGGSHWTMTQGRRGPRAPRGTGDRPAALPAASCRDRAAAWIRSCHDLSEGASPSRWRRWPWRGPGGEGAASKTCPVMQEAAHDAALLVLGIAHAIPCSKFCLENAPSLDRASSPALPLGRLGEVTGGKDSAPARSTIVGLGANAR